MPISDILRSVLLNERSQQGTHLEDVKRGNVMERTGSATQVPDPRKVSKWLNQAI